MSLRFPSLLACLLASACTAAPTDRTPPEPRCADGKCDLPPAPAPRLCAAVRGNGQLIYAHFASLARIVEHYGPVDAIAGGSSASVTSFLTESMELSPAVYDCGDHWCDDGEIGVRTGFLLKSMQAYLAVLGDTDEGLALRQLAPLAARIKAEGIEALAAEDALAARDSLVALLTSEDLRDLINPELLALLRDSPDPAFHVRDILDAISRAAEFDADSDRIFVRPGLLDFSALADKLGRAGSFYAGYGPADHDGMARLLDDCAGAGAGKSWDQIAGLPSGDSTCGQRFASLLADYRTRWAEGDYRSRIDDHVGDYLPALISTSVLTGDTAASFAEARAAYAAAAPQPLVADFAEVRFGYWGHPYDLGVVAANPMGYNDPKTARFHSLGAATWRTVLSYSPAEPGLARALELPGGDVSAGGWSDLAPTLVLRNLGCEQVVYVTRRGDESGFARGVARLLGMTDDDDTGLYDLDTDSAYRLSVDEADGAWCTDWNNMPAFPVQQISADAYGAPLVTEAPFFAGDGAYPNRIAGGDLRGCSPAH